MGSIPTDRPLSYLSFQPVFTSGLTKAKVCTLLLGDGAYKRPLAANRKE